MRSTREPNRPTRPELRAVPDPGGQLILFPTARAGSARRAGEPPARGQDRPGGRGPRSRNARMAARMDLLARDAAREAAMCRRAGDVAGAREAGDRAAGARRAAALLRAGPGGVGEVLAS
jgi:hypothetical protein